MFKIIQRLLVLMTKMKLIFIKLFVKLKNIFFNLPNKEQIIRDDTAEKMFIDDEGDIWLDALETQETPIEAEQTLSTDKAEKIFIDDEGDIWLDALETQETPIEAEQTLSTDKAEKMFIDNEGDIWFSTLETQETSIDEDGEIVSSDKAEEMFVNDKGKKFFTEHGGYCSFLPSIKKANYDSVKKIVLGFIFHECGITKGYIFDFNNCQLINISQDKNSQAPNYLFIFKDSNGNQATFHSSSFNVYFPKSEKILEGFSCFEETGGNMVCILETPKEFSFLHSSSQSFMRSLLDWRTTAMKLLGGKIPEFSTCYLSVARNTFNQDLVTFEFNRESNSLSLSLSAHEMTTLFAKETSWPIINCLMKKNDAEKLNRLLNSQSSGIYDPGEEYCSFLPSIKKENYDSVKKIVLGFIFHECGITKGYIFNFNNCQLINISQDKNSQAPNYLFIFKDSNGNQATFHSSSFNVYFPKSEKILEGFSCFEETVKNMVCILETPKEFSFLHSSSQSFMSSLSDWRTTAMKLSGGKIPEFSTCDLSEDRNTFNQDLLTFEFNRESNALSLSLLPHKITKLFAKKTSWPIINCLMKKNDAEELNRFLNSQSSLIYDPATSYFQISDQKSRAI